MPKVSFNNRQRVFFSALKTDVDAYFESTNQNKYGNFRLYFKTVLLLISAVTLYSVIMLAVVPLGVSVVLWFLLGFVLTLIGFNVMHDACHGSYSSRPFVNDVLGYTLNLIGGNSYIWKFKHNIVHHTYTNIDGMDDDIAKSPLIRMCESQRWVPMHRVQHFYLPLLYGLSTLLWILFQDFAKYFNKKVNNTRMPDMPAGQHIVFWVSKLIYVLIYIVIPILVLGWAHWLIGFLLLNFCMGLTTALVFQLAHVVNETEFQNVAVDGTLAVEDEWAVHQLKTTANFSPKNSVITYLVGGLNYQIEHHLFPKISHIHYPSLSQIVRQKCKEFDLPYHMNETFFTAVRSHFKLIKQLGINP